MKSIDILKNNYLVSVSFDKTIRIWNYETNSQISSYENAHNGNIQCVKVLKNGNYATAGSDNLVKIWNANTYSLISTLSGHTYSVNVLEVLSTGLLVSGSSGTNSVIFWNATTGEFIKSLNPLNANIYCLKEKSDGTFYIGGSSKSIAIYNGATTSITSDILESSGCNAFSIYNNQYLSVAQSSNSMSFFDISLSSYLLGSAVLNLNKDSYCVDSLRKITDIIFKKKLNSNMIFF